jgi:uncharacterized membrane protein
MFGEFNTLIFVYSIGLLSIVLMSFFTYFVSNKFSITLNEKSTTLIFLLSLTFYVLSNLYLGFGKINALHHYVDFATHLEILWRNSQGLGLSTVMSAEYHGGSHWFSAHFTPIIFLTYVPAFKIIPSPLVIPIFETLFLTSSLIPLWLISKRYLNENLSRLLISSFLFYPTIFYTNLYGTSYLELCIPLFFWLFYFFEEKKNKLFILFLILSLMVREEVALVTCFFGIWMFIKKRYLLASITVFLSTIYFYVVMFKIIPYYNGENLHAAMPLYKSYGDTYSEILINILFHPIDFLNKIISLPKIGNFVMMMIPLIFTPFLNLSVLLITIPNLAITFLSDSISHSSFILYYLSPSIPILFYAVITGINKLNESRLVNKNALIYTILTASISATVFFGATPISIAFWNKNYVVGNFYTTNFHRSAYLEEARDLTAKEIIKLIPDNAVISAEQHFLPLLYNKKKMSIFPEPGDDIEYVLIDRFNPKKTGGNRTYSQFRENPEFYYNQYFKNSDWMVVNEELGVTLFKRNN